MAAAVAGRMRFFLGDRSIAGLAVAVRHAAFFSFDFLFQVFEFRGFFFSFELGFFSFIFELVFFSFEFLVELIFEFEGFLFAGFSAFFIACFAFFFRVSFGFEAARIFPSGVPAFVGSVEFFLSRSGIAAARHQEPCDDCEHSPAHGASLSR